MTNNDNVVGFQPQRLDISNVLALQQSLRDTQLLMYGEIHGIKENANIIYSLVHQLGIKRIAIESSPRVHEFITALSHGTCDFSLIDTDTFDSSILSIEVAQTLAVLIQESQIEDIVYVDTYFDTLDSAAIDHLASPQVREEILARNILAIDDTKPALCLLGQWHTQPAPVQLDDGLMHSSALHRLRQVKPDVPFVHVVYRCGAAFNDGRTLTLPQQTNVKEHYCIEQITNLDFDLHVPLAHPTDSYK